MPMNVNAAAVLSAVLARLEFLLRARQNFDDDFDRRIKQLHSQLSRLQKVLDTNNLTEQWGEGFCKKVISLAYNVENAVESHALMLSVPNEMSRVGGIRDLVGHYLGICDPRRCLEKSNSLDELDNLNDRIEKLVMDIVGESVVQNAKTTTEGPERRDERLGHARLPLELDSRQFVIPKGDEREKLISWLLRGYGTAPKISRMAIVGKAGSGKTTLAQKVFKDPVVMLHFQCRAWVSVGQDFQDMREVLSNILLSISPDCRREDVVQMDVNVLCIRLRLVQSNRRCLIVLDDVWSKEVWDTMKIAFSLNPIFKIFMTTRNMEVAHHLKGEIHEIRPLTDEESLELFTRYSGLEGPFNSDIQKQVTGESQGLPQAIITTARDLRKKTQPDGAEIGELQTCDREFQAYPGPEVSSFLNLSYNLLSFKEKLCLLYLGQFPPNHKIQTEKLYLLWIAEGLISSEDPENNGRFDDAEECLRNLVDRSFVMVQNEEVSATKTFESCQLLNELVRDLCLSEGKKEEFFGVANLKGKSQRNVDPFTSTRVALYFPGMHGLEEDIIFANVPDAKVIRSLIFFNGDNSRSALSWPKNVADLGPFQWTRILHFDGIDFEFLELPKNIDKLVYLRYLGFADCFLEDFPSFCCNFPYLETLYLHMMKKSSWNTTMTIPNTLWKLSNLRHLYFPEEFKTEKKDIKLKLDTLTKLEILENFHAGNCNADDLQQFVNLQIFTARADGNTEDFDEIVNFIHVNKQLRHTSITFKEFDSYSEKRQGLLNKMLFKCEALRVLHLEGHIKRVPWNLKNAAYLAEIVLEECEFREDPMWELGNIPHLRSLVLCNNAFVGKKISVPARSFAKLTSLKICNLQYLEELELLEPAAMPNLSILTIEKCNRLSILPRALAKISTLCELRIISMPAVFDLKLPYIFLEEYAMRDALPTISSSYHSKPVVDD